MLNHAGSSHSILSQNASLEPRESAPLQLSGASRYRHSGKSSSAGTDTSGSLPVSRKRKRTVIPSSDASDTDSSVTISEGTKENHSFTQRLSFRERSSEPEESLDISESSDYLQGPSRLLHITENRPLPTPGSSRFDAQSAVITYLDGEPFIQPPPLRYPKSAYHGWKPPVPNMRSEAHALKFLIPDFDILEEEDIYVTLTNFCVYRPREKAYHAETLATLSDLFTRPGESSFLFNGVLQFGNKQCFITDCSFEILSIDGYEPDCHSVSDKIFIQSHLGQKLRVWYHLSSQPAAEYVRFYQPFLWLANFGKHFACYLSSHRNVNLREFKHLFYDWLRELYPTSATLQQWLDEYGRTDFRKAVACNVHYLYRESTNEGVDPEQKNAGHFIWREIHPHYLSAIPRQRFVPGLPTIVTPYIYECFKSFYFADQLRSKIPKPEVLSQIRQVWDNYLSLTWLASNGSWASNSGPKLSSGGEERKVKTGDVISVARDKTTKWKDKSDYWYAYVHDAERDKAGDDFLHVLWLYQPSDTICSTMKYPHPNELFLSDHCNCKCFKRDRIYERDIVDFPSVSFTNRPIPEKDGFFIRRTYITENGANHFIDLQKEHLTCEHRTGHLPSSATRNLHNYERGDTVLIYPRGNHRMEPVEIVRIDQTQNNIEVRQFLRRGRDLRISNSKPNELVHTDYIRKVPASRIARRCHIRSYTRKEVHENQVPAPYKYGGCGDCWIVTCALVNDTVTDLDQSCHYSFKKGFDPSISATPDATDFAPLLRLMDLFCGVKSFGRGFEDAGIAKSEWNIELDATAIHSARANAENPNDQSWFLGQAERYISSAMDGKFSKLIAMIGTVQLLLAGSPCQGFSILQQDKLSSRSRKNASLVTLALAFIDLYRPKYAILENVFGMTRSLKTGKADQNVFHQIICTLVGMGYQTQVFLVNAVNTGQPQYRSRIFISIAAPGHTPLQPPEATHSTPSYMKDRAIGITANGERYGNQGFYPTPFDFVSAAEATEGLPYIGDGAVDICVSVPDHRLSGRLTEKATVVNYIPRFPRRSGLMNSIHRGALASLAKRFLGRKATALKGQVSKTFTRVDPDRIFSTVTTRCGFDDSRDGKWLHWEEPRSISVAEAGEAQRFPDDELLVGSAAEQWKQTGNAVGRYVSVSIAVQLRPAWSQTWIANVGRHNLAFMPPINAAKCFEDAADKRVAQTGVSLELENDTTVKSLQTPKEAHFLPPSSYGASKSTEIGGGAISVDYSSRNTSSRPTSLSNIKVVPELVDRLATNVNGFKKTPAQSLAIQGVVVRESEKERKIPALIHSITVRPPPPVFGETGLKRPTATKLFKPISAPLAAPLHRVIGTKPINAIGGTSQAPLRPSSRSDDDEFFDASSQLKKS